uniref:NADH-ubiquinone oxidoreductase chain 4 n=1 Tax=Phallocryptus tserensodnomi TaxID=1383053 RepID=A0A0U1Z7H7_9CRUS|nr:NADH dehydrogenase subunit 4 [Phallocryptus tserensodnomi]AJP76847.1 NADH dehydrogenase subunit 4 [Phallocryptus tserensodnomi]
MFYPSSLFFFSSFLSLILSFDKSWTYFLLILTGWIFFLMVCCWNPRSKALYLFYLFLLFSFLFLTFLSMSLISFYIFFEACLIPTMLLIMGWGYQPERLPSSFYFLFYTLISSLPLFFVILGFTFYYNSSNPLFFPPILDNLLHLIIILAFLVKLPIYWGHIWLPKAHVEAPVTGSMVLAAVLLKLGGYGLYLFQPFLMSNIHLIVITVGLLGGIYSSILALRQTDVKALIAYSSVAHMSFVIVAMTLSNYYLNTSSIFMMLAHGICSSGLFYLSYLIYLRVSSRSFLLTRGALVSSPYIIFWWFLLIVFNMGVPPSFNLFAELFAFIGVASFSTLCMMLVGFVSFFSSCFCLYLYSSSSHGNSLQLGNFNNSSLNELLVGSLHFLPLLLLILS